MRQTPPLTRETEEPAEFLRMTGQERLQHGVMIVSFALLVATGLPLVFYEWKPLALLFPSGSAFALRGTIHRTGAVLLIGLGVWHFLYIAFTRRGRATFRLLLPNLGDLRDAVQAFMHNLGAAEALERRGFARDFFRRHPWWLFREAPRYGRYNFIEKFEYLAVVWGSAVMIATGFFIWRLDLAMKLFPRYVFDVLVTIHSYEAVLAFLAIVVWHMYNVHFAPAVFPMSRVWLTGRISRERMIDEHPREYEDLVADAEAGSEQ